MPSQDAKKAATAKLIKITTIVYCMVCFLVGQLTRPSSIFTSLKNSVIFAMSSSYLKTPPGACSILKVKYSNMTARGQVRLLDIQIFYILGVGLDELLARQNLGAHQGIKNFVGFFGISHCNL